MRVPKQVYWSSRGSVSVDLADRDERMWWLGKVLCHGTMEDIAGLDVGEVEAALPDLNLPRHVRNLWRDYFEWRDSHVLSPEDP